MNRLVLIDGNAIMHRAYHALPPLTTPDGNVVNVVYGFVSILLKLFHDLKPTHVAVAFDRPGPTFREKLFIKYQAQRPKMEDDFINQISLVHETVEAFGIPIYEMDGFEADDILATLSRQARNPKSEIRNKSKNQNSNKETIDQIIIVTGDRDILQLVEDEKVLVFMPTKGLSEGRLYGEKEVVERMGVTPKLVADLKALSGDPSDNYPGVTGIGPKTAANLLREYGSVTGIYRSLEEVKGKKALITQATASKLLAGRESAMLGLDLATIRRDAPIAFDEKSAIIETLDSPEIRKKLEEFHFPSLLKRLSGEKKVTGEKEKKKEKPNSQQQLF
ncbi:MAG TPA: 5'-3' exonuclease H3TH domain-containing protein [Patescibacteria group bacterium]|nr:5'-3' exonuclease H3TH domain-containing protein [Patescibacteria group bacterium]